MTPDQSRQVASLIQSFSPSERADFYYDTIILGKDPVAYLPAERSVSATQESLAELLKASFGGDRSAAGRYAAEQRWKGHVKKEPAGSPPSGGAGDFMRLINGTPQTYTMRGAIRTAFWSVEGDDDYEDQEKAMADAKYKPREFPWGYAKMTVKEFREMVKSGKLDHTNEQREFLLGQLEDYGDGKKVIIEIGADTIVVRNNPIVAIRPDQPHTPQDIFHLSLRSDNTAQEGEDQGYNSETEKKLTLNTSPRNAGPVKTATLGRWEKAWLDDPYNNNYCKDIAHHAANIMGQRDTRPGPFDTSMGGRTPSQEMLRKDATDMLASINNGTEGQPVLWRGIDTRHSQAKKNVGNADAGDTFVLGLASTSRDVFAAVRYSRDEQPVLLRIEEGSKGISIGDRAIYRHDQEVITSGRFEVVEVEKITVPRWQVPYDYQSTTEQTLSPTQRTALMREPLERLKRIVTPEQFSVMERGFAAVEAKARKTEKETVTVKIISVRQTETFNPETEEFEANG
ncbi:MAG: hypothetical protein EBT75_00185 [Proteobacteria bacterium]|nr:hypothetical protein [Pseudomonadota bacterium]NBS49057.1 hypothetical protein [Verrucomicrobiota bacterium]